MKNRIKTKMKNSKNTCTNELKKIVQKIYFIYCKTISTHKQKQNNIPN